MKYFRLIEANVDVAPFLQEIHANPEVWTLDTGRQDVVDVMRDTQSIFLCSHGHSWIEDRKALRRVPVSYLGRPTSNADPFTRTSLWVKNFIESTNGRAGRVSIARIKPHGQVYRHKDGAFYYHLRHRYHLVVKSAGGSLFRAGVEEVRMREGEVWWFDNQIPHEAFNESDEERIHVVFDVLSPRSFGYFFLHAVLWRYPRGVLRRIVRVLREPSKSVGRLRSNQ